MAIDIWRCRIGGTPKPRPDPYPAPLRLPQERKPAMLFKITLFAVIVYLAACYAYGLYLLWKLYTGRRLGVDTAKLTGQAVLKTTPTRADRDTPRYEAPAKAA